MPVGVERTGGACKSVSKCKAHVHSAQKCLMSNSCAGNGKMFQNAKHTCGVLLVDSVVARTTMPKSNTHMREVMTPCYVLSLFVFDALLSPNVTELAHLFLSPKEMTKDILVSFRLKYVSRELKQTRRRRKRKRHLKM